MSESMFDFVLSALQDVDSYKSSHYLMFPPNMTDAVYYSEARPGAKWPATMFFGLQYYLKRYLTHRITAEEVGEMAEMMRLHGEPFNRDGWMEIVNKMGGRLPLRIRAVPEGTVVPNQNVLMTVENTVPGFHWLAGWVETMLVRLWYPQTVATLSWNARKILREYLEKTADEPEKEIPFKLHDFGSRGATTQEAAALGGASHLVNFMGTDTVAGLWLARKYYFEDCAGFSIPAQEHSTITPWKYFGGEGAGFKYQIERVGAAGYKITASVSDSFDLWNAIDNVWGEELRDYVENGEVTVVVRPDGGKPWEIVPKMAERLARKFKTYTNTKGYTVFNKVRIIQGDGNEVDNLGTTMQALIDKGFSATNLAFGMGAGLLQKVNRDTQQMGYKLSAFRARQQSYTPAMYTINKNPVDSPWKASKAGYLDLVYAGDGQYKTVAMDEWGQIHPQTALRIVFKDGEMIEEDTFAMIRKRAWGCSTTP